MADWLDRVRRELASRADRGTAETAERNPTAVMAVPHPGDAEISRDSIGSNGSIAAPESLEIEAATDDDRRTCAQCANLTERGLCLAARRGDIVASRSYEPMCDLRRRCEGYVPGTMDVDRRPGRERWPGLIKKGSDDAGQ